MLCFFITLLYATPLLADVKVGTIVPIDIGALIDLQPIESYNMNGEIYIAAEDLKGYGFDVNWSEQEQSLQIARNAKAERIFLPKEKINILKSDILQGKQLYDVYTTNQSVYLNGEKITPCYNMQGKIIIKFSTLSKIADMEWNEKYRQLHAFIAKFEMDHLLKQASQEKISIESKDIHAQIEYIGDTLNNIPNGFGTKTVKTKETCSNSVYHYIGNFKNGKEEGIFYNPYLYELNDCSNHLYSILGTNILNYENGELNGYCIKTGQSDGYPCQRIEGYYKDGKLNGWARKEENDTFYVYGFKITEEGMYKDDFLIDYTLDTSTKESDIVSVSCEYDYTAFFKNDGSIYISGMVQGIKKNVPIKYRNNIKKIYEGNNDFIITQDNRLYNLNGEKPILIDDGVKDVNEDCYLKENGELYYFNKEKIADNVSKISDSGRILFLKNDGSVWYFRAKPKENCNWIDGKDLSTPILIMEDCKDISSDGSYHYFAIKNDNTLWG